MKQFSLAESGMFSAGGYSEDTRTLTVVFRTTGKTYDVTGVSKELGEDFMTASGKSAIWHQTLKHLGPVAR